MKTLRRNARKEIRSFGIRVLGISQEQSFANMFKEALKKINIEEYEKDYKRREEYRLNKKTSKHNEEHKKTFEEAIKIIKKYQKNK